MPLFSYSFHLPPINKIPRVQRNDEQFRYRLKTLIIEVLEKPILRETFWRNKLKAGGSSQQNAISLNQVSCIFGAHRFLTL